MTSKQPKTPQPPIPSLAAVLRPGVASLTTIAHDDWCRIFKGGECNCSPDVTISTIKKETQK